MPDILLATINAKYIHASFGLRYLLANLGTLQSQTQLLEFDLQQRPLDIAERILQSNPRILGLGVYVWNVAPATELVTLLKRLRPDLLIILGGPEVSHESPLQPIVQLADYVIAGEADLAFPSLCHDLLNHHRPNLKLIHPPLPDLNQLTLPYDLYTDDDVAHRIVYVEASRGCPFTCEFCLSSLDPAVRTFPLSSLFPAFERLLARGVKTFKFVDRTFNLNIESSRSILAFFLEHYRPDLFLHFEMIPDRLPDALREWIVRFPPGALQFEVGIQTFNLEVADRIRRRQNLQRLEDNLRFLRKQTTVHIHADLIAGLPGEPLESFAAGFDRLISLAPHEIQVGILKRLRGTPIARHDSEWQMIYSPQAPYEILQNRSISFFDLQRLRRFARYWDLIGNSGRFVHTTPCLWHELPSPFYAFMHWSDWLFARTAQRHAFSLTRLVQLLFEYLVLERNLKPEAVRACLESDFKGNLPPLIPAASSSPSAQHHLPNSHSKRQRRQLPPPSSVSAQPQLAPP